MFLSLPLMVKPFYIPTILIALKDGVLMLLRAASCHASIVEFSFIKKKQLQILSLPKPPIFPLDFSSVVLLAITTVLLSCL